MTLFTIGFTKKSAQRFFTALSDAGVKTLIDVRLNNVSQLAGFSKKEDIRYFLQAICGIQYVHMPILAPTQSLLDEYKKQHREWSWYESEFLRLIRDRKVEEATPRELVDQACLLCSESTAERCHRRLVAEYLKE